DVGVCGTQVEAFPAADVATGFDIYVRWQNGLLTHSDICREIFIESPIAHPSAMLRRAEMVSLGGYQDRGWAEDYDLWLRYHAAGRRFAKVPEPLVRWREHEARATRTDSRYSIENFLRAKSHYLAYGPLASRDGLMVWGAGRTGRRLSKHLIRAGHRPDAFIDIAANRIGSTMRGIPIIGPDDVMRCWQSLRRPMLLAAVASRGARALIREQLGIFGLTEGVDYLCVA
ncbi:MAG: glycosyl transferase, partial [Gemmatimonadetes bacterium]|nr:glycosyl transferase [Gemmatimonadota bacterium]